MDYTQFQLNTDTLLKEAIYRCKCEMYKRAQPSVDYNTLLKMYKIDKTKTRFYERYYLSQEEFEYIQNKYIEAYRLSSRFVEHCDLIISNMKEGTITDQYIPEKIDPNGFKHPGYRGYKDVPPLDKTIGENHAKIVIDYINDRKEFYNHDQDLNSFKFSISLGDSPTSNENSVVKYWAEQGIDIKIDPRHHNQEYFWNEEHGYLEDDDE